jgi:hypothetical protein
MFPMNASDPSHNAEEASPDHAAGGGSRGGNDAALGPADWLALAAAPTFAIMALLVGASSEASRMSGMVVMYVLMAIFEAVPWLKLVSSRRSG